MSVEIGTDFNVTADLVTKLNNVAGIKGAFEKSAEQKNFFSYSLITQVPCSYY